MVTLLYIMHCLLLQN